MGQSNPQRLADITQDSLCKPDYSGDYEDPLLAGGVKTACLFIFYPRHRPLSILRKITYFLPENPIALV